MAAEKHNNKDSQTTNTSAGRTPAGSKNISFDSKAFVGALLRKLTQLSYIKPGEVPNIRSLYGSGNNIYGRAPERYQALRRR